MLQASICDGGAFDPFSLKQNCLSATEVDVGGRQIFQTLVIAAMIVVLDEFFDVRVEIAG